VLHCKKSPTLIKRGAQRPEMLVCASVGTR
jgi:hypothetical protein